MELNTFTLDSMKGKFNPEFIWLRTKTTNNLRNVIHEYIMDCIDNNIEVCSANCFFMIL